MKQGLLKILPHAKDYSLIPSIAAGAVYGAVPTDPKGLPDNFSIYDGRVIPNQDAFDGRFTPSLIPLPYGCTAETGTFDAGLQDGDLYTPYDLYVNTPPGNLNQGRDMRAVLQVLIDRGPKRANATFGPKRRAYFNCYGYGAIDDFDAARIALWINQSEKRGVWVGSWWYDTFALPRLDGTLATPSYNTSQATLHAHLVTGWKLINSELYLESISWQGMHYGDQGKVYFTRAQYNRLMQQPYTGAFTQTKLGVNDSVPVGYQAIIDHLIYFVRQLFHV